MPSLLTRARPGPPATDAGGRSRQVSRKAFSALVAGLGVAVAVSVVLATMLGPVSVPLSESWRTVWHHVFPGSVAAPRDPLFDQIVWQFRLPRALLGTVIGAGLGVVGCALQAAVRNPLADPYLLGISSGASFGAVLVLVLGSEAAAGLSLSVAAFVGALTATALVYVLAKRRGRITPFRLILAGVALAYLFQAMYSYLLIKANPYATQGVLFWLLGSLGSATWSDLGLPAAAVLAGSAYLLLQARSLNSVLAGEETAVSLGLNINRFRVRILVVTSLLVGVMVAVSGAIAFVGLIIPHLCRLVVGSDHRRLLPTAALTGAAFLVFVDLAARTIDQPAELPLSVVTAVFGVPFFIWLLRSRERSREGVFG
ncbi:MAG: FecCD family ABC transporter permease [Egibacteraceae bacterium]